MLCITMFCVAKNASVTGNFANKNRSVCKEKNSRFCST
ncbi:hypothetical protein PARMER_02439 [Parabacteroides merdae ATCC 43184]|nr:hypothetical protein PARMER_02439 [Parabacteroides merdae ATCC 43184]